MKFVSIFLSLLGNARKTVATPSASREPLRSSSRAERRASTPFALLLIPLVAMMPLQAETPVSVPGATTPASQSTTLQIRLASAGKATVEANASVKGYSIIVTDASGLPVADVAVAIRLPEDGATGFFAEGIRSAVAYTDASGIAKFGQLNWGSIPGTVAIRVTAAKGELHAGALIEQTIVAQSASGSQAQPPAARISPFPSDTGDSNAATPAMASSAAADHTDTSSPAPGTPTSVASVHSGAGGDTTPHTTETATSTEPAVSIVNTAGSKGGSGSNKKWIILAAVAVAAGVGAAVAIAGKGGAASPPASPGLSIGTPSISVGH